MVMNGFCHVEKRMPYEAHMSHWPAVWLIWHELGSIPMKPQDHFMVTEVDLLQIYIQENGPSLHEFRGNVLRGLLA
jgi:hypothetical protein